MIFEFIHGGMATVTVYKSYKPDAFGDFLANGLGYKLIHISACGNTTVSRSITPNNRFCKLHAAREAASSAVSAWKHSVDLLYKRVARYCKFPRGEGKSQSKDKPHCTEYDCGISDRLAK